MAGLIYGAIGIAQAGPSPCCAIAICACGVASYPVALLNSLGTAFIDEAAFRGAILGYLILIGVPAGSAIILQAVGYGLVTRLGAPGRDRYMLVLSIVIGLASGYVTLRTGGIGAAFLGHAVARFATFVATVTPASRRRSVARSRRSRRSGGSRTAGRPWGPRASRSTADPRPRWTARLGASIIAL